MADLKIRLQPKQGELARLWNDRTTTRLGSGGARGGSKSGGARRIIVSRRLEYPNTPGLVLRRTQRKLHESHIVKLFEEAPSLRPWYREQKKELLFPNGSRLVFGSAEHTGDLANFYSAEYADIFIDEAQEFSQGELEDLTGSNRCTTNSDITPKMVYSFMPGISDSGLPPKGLPYLKRVFVDQDLRGEEKNVNWDFVQAFAWDNIEWARKELTRDKIGRGEHRPGAHDCVCQECTFYSWPEDKRREYFIARTEFGSNLNALTNKYLRDAWLYGKWDTFQGQYFPNFDYERHTADASSFKVEKWHKRWISGDWGFDHPACFHWFAQDEHGRVTTYREMWVREMGETALGKKITELTGDEKLSAFYLSWDAFGKLNRTTKKSITEMIGAALKSGIPKPTPADASPGSRISGWRLMHQLLDSGQWLISRDCPKLIECMPTLIRDMEKNPEDVLKVDWSENYIGDDPGDSARYGLQNMLSGAVKPQSVIRQELLGSFDERIARIRARRSN